MVDGRKKIVRTGRALTTALQVSYFCRRGRRRRACTAIGPEKYLAAMATDGVYIAHLHQPPQLLDVVDDEWRTDSLGHGAPTPRPAARHELRRHATKLTHARPGLAQTTSTFQRRNSTPTRTRRAPCRSGRTTRSGMSSASTSSTRPAAGRRRKGSTDAPARRHRLLLRRGLMVENPHPAYSGALRVLRLVSMRLDTTAFSCGDPRRRRATADARAENTRDTRALWERDAEDGVSQLTCGASDTRDTVPR